ncbi:type I-F CRISPR-associated endoribonuclease Cas6/Csy4 [Zooshikella sp. RANM57]|uniref:type I-F CRISPR-associated endoribonuclease Cas6/Csy4 n=1 Tax=Zooshikella sp. RANM57 TaxID=3425863 RepID=UPI003D6E9B2F
MDYFVDIRLMPDPEFSGSTLMNVLFNKLHKGLVTLNTTTIGICFPEYSIEKKELGNKLRIHGSAGELDQLLCIPWLTGMRDHLMCSEITKIPANTTAVCVQRVQVKSNVERIRRRYMKRHNLSEEEAKLRIPATFEKRLNLPYLVVNSQSTQQKFRLFIHQEELAVHRQGKFNQYGLSKQATVHYF